MTTTYTTNPTGLDTLSCPACATELVINQHEGIEIDICPDCRGVWLDRGELDKIIQIESMFYDPPQKRAIPMAQPNRERKKRGPDSFADLFEL